MEEVGDDVGQLPEEDSDGVPSLVLLLPHQQVVLSEDLEYCYLLRTEGSSIVVGPWQTNVLLFAPSGHLLQFRQRMRWEEPIPAPARSDFTTVTDGTGRGDWRTLPFDDVSKASAGYLLGPPSAGGYALQVLMVLEEQGDEFGLHAWTGAILSNRVEFEFLEKPTAALDTGVCDMPVQP